jgi:hypothetical protein
MTRAKITYQPFTLVVLLVSLAAFIVRAGEYLLLGSVFPSVFITCVVVMIGSAYMLGGATWFRRAVKVWGGILVLYGILRILLGGMIQTGLIDSAHAVDAASIVYMILSVVYVAAGIYILRFLNARK